MNEQFKVRLADGTVSPPLDRAGLQRWYDERRIGPDAPVMTKGSPRPQPLRDVLGLAAGDAGGGDGEWDGWHVSSLLLAGSILPVLYRSSDKDALGGGVVTALLLFVLSYGCWRRSPAARIATLAVMGLGVCALFALLAVPTSEVVGLRAFFRLTALGGLLTFAGYLLMLVGSASRARVVAGAILTIGAAGLGFVAERRLLPQVVGSYTREQAAAWGESSRSWSDDSIGLKIDLPPGWTILRPDSPLAQNSGARLALVHEAGSFAELVVSDKSEHEGPDAVMDAIIEEQRRRSGSATETEREATTMSRGEGRHSTVRFTDKGIGISARLAAWSDYTRQFALYGWGPEAAAVESRAAFAALEAAMRMTYPLTRSRASVMESVATACPHLTDKAIGIVLHRAGDRVLSTGEVFRRAFGEALRGVGNLPPADLAEIRRLNVAILSHMDGAGHARYDSWAERVRAGVATRPDEDDAANATLVRAYRAIPAADQEIFRRVMDSAIYLAP